VIGPAGLAAADNDAAFADATERLLALDETGRRQRARQQAERFGWPAAVDGFLRAHGIRPWPHNGPACPPARHPGAPLLDGSAR
jgi:hypothetical protein